MTALDAQAQAGTETHLYLTDYRSLYVAEVGEVTDEDVREDAGEAHHADFWFRLFDIRRLVSDDTPAVIEEAGKLRNVGYHDRPVSLYRGMVDLPLIVHREPEAQWFSDRDALTEGGLWAERAAALRSDTERMSRERKGPSPTNEELQRSEVADRAVRESWTVTTLTWSASLS